MPDESRYGRLAAELHAMRALKAASSILDFECRGDPPDRYTVIFHGRGICRSASRTGRVEVVDRHRIEIRLAARYPNLPPGHSLAVSPLASERGLRRSGGTSRYRSPMGSGFGTGLDLRTPVGRGACQLRGPRSQRQSAGPSVLPTAARAAVTHRFSDAARSDSRREPAGPVGPSLQDECSLTGAAIAQRVR